MKIENKNISRIDFDHTKSTYGDELGDYDEINGKAIFFDDEDYKEDTEYIAGNVEAYFMNVENIEDSIHDLLDSISGDHVGFSEYFNQQNKINKKIRELLNLSDEDVEMISCNFIYFHRLKVEKKYRGLGIGKTLIHSTINDYKRDASIAFLKAAPLQFTNKEIDNNTTEEDEFQHITENASRKKLIKLYESYNFKEIPNSEGDMVAYIGDWFHS